MTPAEAIDMAREYYVLQKERRFGPINLDVPSDKRMHDIGIDLEGWALDAGVFHIVFVTDGQVVVVDIDLEYGIHCHDVLADDPLIELARKHKEENQDGR